MSRNPALIMWTFNVTCDGTCREPLVPSFQGEVNGYALQVKLSSLAGSSSKAERLVSSLRLASVRQEVDPVTVSVLEV